MTIASLAITHQVRPLYSVLLDAQAQSESTVSQAHVRIHVAVEVRHVAAVGTQATVGTQPSVGVGKAVVEPYTIEGLGGDHQDGQEGDDDYGLHGALHGTCR